MKFIASLSFLSLLVLCLGSCKKTPSAVTYPNYGALKTGNYWVYQEYNIDTLGNATALQIFDSCYITKDTVINNNTYYVLVGPYALAGSNALTYQYLRDSLDYIVDNFGTIVFSSQHLGVVFNTYANASDTITSEMVDTPTTIQVPAGVYSTLSLQQTTKYPPQFTGYGPRYRNTRYSQNTGIVSETLYFFVYNDYYTERRLVRYHLN